MLVLPQLRADVVSVTDRASIRAGRTRDVTAGVTEPINSWLWEGDTAVMSLPATFSWEGDAEQ